MAALELRNITIDCHDQDRLVAFWTAALGYKHLRNVGPYAVLVSDPRGRPNVLLQKVPEGKLGKNRVHLDFRAESEADVERLVALGATRLRDVAEDGLAWTVMADPEGNEFCVTVRKA